ncbi:MAG: hypothetical protein K2L36_01945, partial [Eubacterium sp.]|nr:hypothetical protein [Eubacterium sp.]
LVEHHVRDVGVASSNLVTSTNEKGVSIWILLFHYYDKMRNETPNFAWFLNLAEIWEKGTVYLSIVEKRILSP